MQDEEDRRLAQEGLSSPEAVALELLRLERLRMSHQQLPEMDPQEAVRFAKGFSKKFVEAIASFNTRHPDEDSRGIDYRQLYQAAVTKTLEVLFRQGRISSPEVEDADEAGQSQRW